MFGYFRNLSQSQKEIEIIFGPITLKAVNWFHGSYQLAILR